jgi:hypothetical protein
LAALLLDAEQVGCLDVADLLHLLLLLISDKADPATMIAAAIAISRHLLPDVTDASTAGTAAGSCTAELHQADVWNCAERGMNHAACCCSMVRAMARRCLVSRRARSSLKSCQIQPLIMDFNEC